MNKYELLQVVCFCLTFFSQPHCAFWPGLKYMYIAVYINTFTIKGHAKVDAFYAKQHVWSVWCVWVCLQFSFWSAFIWIIITLWRFFPPFLTPTSAAEAKCRGGRVEAKISGSVSFTLSLTVPVSFFFSLRPPLSFPPSFCHSCSSLTWTTYVRSLGWTPEPLLSLQV